MHHLPPWKFLSGACIFSFSRYLFSPALAQQNLLTLKDGGSINFYNLALSTLPLGPAASFPNSLIPWGMWLVNMDR